MRKVFLFSVIFLAYSASAFSNQCVSGSPNQLHLVEQLTKAEKSSSITQKIQTKYGLTEKKKSSLKNQACSDCEPIANPLGRKNQFALFEISEKINASIPEAKKPLAFKPACLKAAVDIKTPTNELLCPENKTDPSKNSHDLCMTEKMLEYQNAVVTDIQSCINQITDSPVSLAGLFEMYSLESTFKPHYAYSGGVGLGQLTSIFVKDVQQKHRGLSVLKSVAASKNPDCEVSAQIAQKDLSGNFPSLYPNRCQFVQYGEGLERNVLYTLVGLANWWKKDIGPLFKSYKEKYKDSPDLSKALELSLLNAYGSGGTAAGRAASRRLIGKDLPPKEFIEQMKKPLLGKKGTNLTRYSSNIAKKQTELKKKLSGQDQQSFNQKGSLSCLASN